MRIREAVKDMLNALIVPDTDKGKGQLDADTDLELTDVTVKNMLTETATHSVSTYYSRLIGELKSAVRAPDHQQVQDPANGENTTAEKENSMSIDRLGKQLLKRTFDGIDNFDW